MLEVPSFSPQTTDASPEDGRSKAARSSFFEQLPFLTFLLGVVFWILAVVPMRFGAPWSQISFTTGYGAIFTTAFMVAQIVLMEPVDLERGLSSLRVPRKSGRQRSIGAREVKPCTTCALFAEFTGDFKEIWPKEEALYLEHLMREHGLDP